MIDNITDSNVNAIVNFINGLKINSYSIISQAIANIVTIPTDDESIVDLTVNQQGKKHFSFRMLKAKIVYISTYLVVNNLFSIMIMIIFLNMSIRSS